MNEWVSECPKLMKKATQSKPAIIIHTRLASVFKGPTSEVFADVLNIIRTILSPSQVLKPKTKI